MRTISDATLAILKSQNLTGQDKFNHQLMLEGVDYYSDITGASTNTVSSGTVGDFCLRSDGKILYAYKTGQQIYLNVIDKEEDLMSVANIGSGGTLFYTVNAPEPINTSGYTSVRLFRLKSGKILLLINEYGASGGGNFKNLVFRSDDGLGSIFTLISTLYERAIDVDRWTYGVQSTDIAKPVQGPDGTIYCRVPYAYLDLGNLRTGFKVIKSINDGLTWTELHSWYTGFAVMNYLRSNGLIEFELNGNKYLISILKHVVYSDPTIFMYFSADGGTTWTTWSTLNSAYFFMSYLADDYNYLVACGDTSAYRIKKSNVTSIAALTNLSNWEKIQDYTTRPVNGLIITPRGYMHVLGNNNVLYPSLVTDLTMTRDVYSAPLQASSISISKGRGGANTASIQASNKNGVLNPKNPDSPLYGILGTNKQVIIKQGYGEDLIESFTGLIDGFDMSTWPQTTNISLRDNLKKALDQTVTYETQHTIHFELQAIENIVGYLCYLAGIETGEIEATGIQVAKTFSWESYADCFQFLGDLASFEWGCDEYGKFYFRRDYQPDDMYVAYTFEEGVDISALRYTIKDDDLYYKVAVFGKSGDTVISYEAPFLDAASYNIMQQKILKIDATEATTTAELQKIAERAIALMQSRTAVVNFTAVAVPWLQVGDFIGVYERSTGAASIYRISSLKLDMDSDSFTMSIDAYYYGDSIVPGELPTEEATQTAAPTTNIIPEMTSNTAPSGVARASSVYTSAYEPWQAFNSTDTDLYWNAITNTGWIEYQFSEKMIVDKYSLKARQAIEYNDAMPKAWTFEGFDGAAWVVLDTRSAQTAWGINEVRTFLFANTTAYSKYRLNVSVNNGYNRLQLEQLGMYYGGGS